MSISLCRLSFHGFSTIRVAGLLICWLRAPKQVSQKSQAGAASFDDLASEGTKAPCPPFSVLWVSHRTPPRLKGREVKAHSPVGGSHANTYGMCVCVKYNPPQIFKVILKKRRGIPPSTPLDNKAKAIRRSILLVHG